MWDTNITIKPTLSFIRINNNNNIWSCLIKEMYKHICRPSLGVTTLLCCLQIELCWLGLGLGLSVRFGGWHQKEKYRNSMDMCGGVRTGHSKWVVVGHSKKLGGGRFIQYRNGYGVEYVRVAYCWCMYVSFRCV